MAFLSQDPDSGDVGGCPNRVRLPLRWRQLTDQSRADMVRYRELQLSL